MFTKIMWKLMICQIPPSNRREKSQCKLSSPCQHRQIPWKMFGYHEVPSNTMNYVSIHNLLRYLYLSSNTLFEWGYLYKSVVWGWYLTEAFTHITLMKTRSLAYSAFQFRLAATGLGEKGAARARKRKVTCLTPLRAKNHGFEAKSHIKLVTIIS